MVDDNNFITITSVYIVKLYNSLHISAMMTHIIINTYLIHSITLILTANYHIAVVTAIF